MTNKIPSERGAVTIIIGLIMLSIITASAVVLGGALSRQIRATQDVVTTERAFYAANSGFEHALYVRLRQQQDVQSGNAVTGELEYIEGNAQYNGQAYLTGDNQICALGEGTFRGLVRKLAFGTAECTF